MLILEIMYSITHYRNLTYVLSCTRKCRMSCDQPPPCHAMLAMQMQTHKKKSECHSALSAMYNSLEITPLTATPSCPAIKAT